MSINKQNTGAVMIIGGGITGIQAALDLANSGYYVYIVERGTAIGGVMSQLDKTFPTNDCAMWIISPKLVEVGRHINIEILTLSTLKKIKGKEGNFTVKILSNPRYIDTTKCISCGACSTKCPKKIPNEYNEYLDKRKAIYISYPQAVPLKYVIDKKNCIYFIKGKCQFCKKSCPTNAINYEEKPILRELKVGSLIISTGSQTFNPNILSQYSYSKFPNVVTALEFENLIKRHKF